MTLKCLITGHEWDLINKFTLTRRPSKYITDSSGNLIVQGQIYGIVSYVTEEDMSKDPVVVGYEKTYMCSRCGKIKKVEV